jgi:hypothetical protein
MIVLFCSRKEGKLSAWFVKNEFRLKSGRYVMLWDPNKNEYIGWW